MFGHHASVSSETWHLVPGRLLWRPAHGGQGLAQEREGSLDSFLARWHAVEVMLGDEFHHHSLDVSEVGGRAQKHTLLRLRAPPRESVRSTPPGAVSPGPLLAPPL